ncbi:MAG: hypothetical protein WDW38_010655 [Sanguina aurantia]
MLAFETSPVTTFTALLNLSTIIPAALSYYRAICNHAQSISTVTASGQWSIFLQSVAHSTFPPPFPIPAWLATVTSEEVQQLSASTAGQLAAGVLAGIMMNVVAFAFVCMALASPVFLLFSLATLASGIILNGIVSFISMCLAAAVASLDSLARMLIWPVTLGSWQ